MANLFSKIMLFMVIGGIFIFPLSRFYHHATQEALSSPVFLLAPHKSFLITGDSHTQTSIDPEFLQNAVNLSSSGENYFYTYYKLAHFLRLNQNIRSVILGFAPHNIMKTYDPYIYDNHGNQWQTYMPLLDQDARDKIACLKTTYLIPLLQYDYGIPFRAYDDLLPIKKVLGRGCKTYDFPFYGGYEKRKGSYNSEKFTRSKIATHFLDANGAYVGVSPDMVQYQ